MPDLAPLAEVVDRVLSGPAVVVGSLPEDARDLDVVAAPRTASALTSALGDLGFGVRGRTGLKVGSGRVWVVEVDATDTFGPPPKAVDAMLDESLPLLGYRSLRRPRPHHQLLLLAWRRGQSDEPLPDRWRLRIAEALREDPSAWSAAAGDADLWELDDRLDRLRTASTGALPRRRPSLDNLARRVKRRRGALVAVSGIDGAGKSTQAAILADGLRALGYEGEVEWTRITYDPSLDRIARPVKALLATAHRGRAQAQLEPSATEATAVPVPANHGRALRERSKLIAFGWATIVSTVDGIVLRRTTRRHLRGGRFVIRDRFVLDSTVQLLDQYGASYEFQTRLIRALAPRPLRAFLLDVPAEIAWSRKPEEYDVVALDRHRRRYLERVGRVGVEIIDGTAPADEVSMELIMRVWTALQPVP